MNMLTYLEAQAEKSAEEQSKKFAEEQAEGQLEERYEERDGMSPFYIALAVRKGMKTMPYYHYHPTYEIFYVKSGQVDMAIGNRYYTITDGSLFVIPPYVPHRSAYTDGKITKRLEINVNQEVLCAPIQRVMAGLSEGICYTLSTKYRDHIEKLLDKTMKEANGKQEYSEELCRAYLEEILILLHRHAWLKENAVLECRRLPQRIMEYVSNHYYENLTVARLAEIHHVSESTIYKSFKRYTGIKIADYLNFTRIMNAERLMRESELSLQEIAFQCGFHDSNYFSTVFKKYKDTTPGQFMKKCRGTRLSERE